jgi:hypothetical protein
VEARSEPRKPVVATSPGQTRTDISPAQSDLLLKDFLHFNSIQLIDYHRLRYLIPPQEALCGCHVVPASPFHHPTPDVKASPCPGPPFNFQLGPPEHRMFPFPRIALITFFFISCAMRCAPCCATSALYISSLPPQAHTTADPSHHK